MATEPTPLHEGEMMVVWPLGRVWLCRGKVWFGKIGDMAALVVDDGGPIILPDIRSAVATKDGTLIHSPRWRMGELPRWAVKWLRDHPRWPPAKFRQPPPSALFNPSDCRIEG